MFLCIMRVYSMLLIGNSEVGLLKWLILSYKKG